MGAMIALLLILSSLAACAGETLTDVKNDPSALADHPAVITYAAELEHYADVIKDEDGVMLASYSYTVPVLQAVREDGTEITDPLTPAETQALAVTAAFNDRFTEWTAEEDAQKLADDARTDRTYREASSLPWEEINAYTADLSCTVYQTDTLVSVSAWYSSYTGGAHPNTVLAAWNFDLTSGAFFKPETLAADSQEFSAMVQGEIILQARERAAETAFWDSYEQIAGDWCSYAVSFHETGMTVGYSPYEMACYAAGPQEFTLDYECLRPYLSGHGMELLGLSEEAA